MKVKIDADERYPVYGVGDYGYEVDIPPATLKRWRRAAETFEAAQAEMGDLYDAAEAAEKDRRAEERAEREAAERAERKRVEAERKKQAAARKAKEDAMWQRIKEAGGTVYDADGNPLATVAVTGPSGGVKLEP